ncbi:hypothetical protein GE09DRAFT_1262526 [Coniochaeta sp. 2T2.1]|nr:hypothetical protein GE09DRAFT_1262526 [Coniochaeta sp. 2T2.1]
MARKKANAKNKTNGILTSGDATTATRNDTPPISDVVIGNTTTAHEVNFQLACPGCALCLLALSITTSFRLLWKCFSCLTRPLLCFAGNILYIMFAVVITIFCWLWVFFASLRTCVYAAFWAMEFEGDMANSNRQTALEDRILQGSNSVEDQYGGVYPDVGNRRERRMRKWMDKRGYRLVAVEEYED